MIRRASLRAKIVVYLLVIHAALGVVAWFVLSVNRYLLLAAEAFFAVSIVMGIVLVRALFVPLRMVTTGAELMREQDFTTHFRPVGQPELDDLIRIYNLMIDRLREERLGAQEQRSFLEKVLDASPAGVLTLDYEGRVNLLNPSAARLLAAASATGPPSALPPPVGKRLSEIGHPLTDALASIRQGESRVLALQGSRRMKAAHAVFYDRGHPRSFFLLEELTEELRASEKAAYEKLIRMITHEVNNSVGAVRSLLESLRHYADQIEGEDRSDFTGALDVASGRMNNLNAFMRGFAEVVRLPSPDLRPCDLKALVDDILLLLRPELEGRRIQATWDAAHETDPILLDKNQMEQVLVNVLKNAMESIGSEGRIGLSLTREGARTLLRIRDTGSGVSEDARARLFTPFFSTKRDGRGLGLTVVREILAQHRFGFSLEGLPDGGAEFQVRF